MGKGQVRIVTLISDWPRGCILVLRYYLVKNAALSVLAACHQGWAISNLGIEVIGIEVVEEEVEDRQAWSPSMGRAGTLASSFCLKVQGTRLSLPLKSSDLTENGWTTLGPGLFAMDGSHSSALAAG